MIALVPYDPEWARRFEAERSLLERVLAPWLEGGVEHVGSTAIPGIAAKPIVDMVAGVRDLEEARAAYEPLHAVGYVDEPHRPEIAHHFAKPALELDARRLNLHLTEPSRSLWRERLAFRDELRADPALAAEYEALKLRLAGERPGDVRTYTDGSATSSAACSSPPESTSAGAERYSRHSSRTGLTCAGASRHSRSSAWKKPR